MPLKPALNIRPKSILLATDFSPASQNALRHALALTRHYGATLHIAHVVSSMGFTLAGPEAVAIANEAARRDILQAETDMRESGRLAGINYDTTVRDGEVWPQLERLIDEDHADMVVIGTHGRRGLGRLLLGSVAEKIFRGAECPVVTVGPAFAESGVENIRQPQPVLFATDFGSASLQALPYVIDFASERNVKLVLLHVIQTVPLPASEHWDTADDVISRRRQAEAEAIERLRGWLRRQPTICREPEFVVKFGDPAEEILKLSCALRADAIAMGLHRTAHAETATHFRRTLAYEVVCRAKCAVFTARN
jgi:nucleotide-binding universal stress UspA family protein